MAYQGIVQVWCKAGHYHEYEFAEAGPTEHIYRQWMCRCDERAAFVHQVQQISGNLRDYVEPIVVVPEVREPYNCCGASCGCTRVRIRARYEVPLI